jgi:hypothetical protein
MDGSSGESAATRAVCWVAGAQPERQPGLGMLPRTVAQRAHEMLPDHADVSDR